jgi:uncharacterized sulfatase
MTSIHLDKKYKLSICVFFASSILFARETQNKPNVVFILADDLGWADLPIYGNKFNEAPNLSKLARQGVKFTNAYSAAPVSSPTRASIQTGLYPARLGINDFIPGHSRPFEEVKVPVNRTQYLPSEAITFAEMLQKAGYMTAYFGKWHLGVQPQHLPVNQGYNEMNVGQGFYNVTFTPARGQSKEKIISERLADFSIDFIEKNKKNPFLLFVSEWDVHCPYDSEQKLIEKYHKKTKVTNYPCNAVYAAMIEQMDKSIGRIIDKLEKEGLVENTVFIFCSDNGGVISENKYPYIKEEKFPLITESKRNIYSRDNPLQYIGTVNTPLRSEKGSLYEGGIRVPLIVKWPARVKANKVSDVVLSSVDLFPTILEIARVKLPENQEVDGKSFLSSLISGQPENERPVFWHYPVYHHDVPASAVREGDWKLIENLVNGTVELYNLKVDIGETTDLSKVFPEKANELYVKLKDWQKELKADLPAPNLLFDKFRRFEWGKQLNH